MPLCLIPSCESTLLVSCSSPLSLSYPTTWPGARSARPARGQGRRRPGAGSSGGVQGLPSGARRKQRRGPALVRRADGVHGAVTGPSSRGAGAPLSAAVQGQAFAGDVRRRRSGPEELPAVGRAAVGRAGSGRVRRSGWKTPTPGKMSCHA